MKHKADTSKNKRRILALSVGLFLLAVYLFSYRGGFHSVDEVSMFAVTESLVKFGRFNTDQIAWTQWTTTQAEAQGFFGADGHLYSKKGLALSLAQAPLYGAALLLPGLGMLQTVSLLNAGLTAATGLLLFMFLWRMHFSTATAVITALLFGLATISFVYAKYLFSEPLAGFFLLLAAYMLFTYRQEGGLRHIALGGLAAGLAVLTRANNLFLLPVFGLYLLWIAGQRTRNKSQRLAGWLLPLLVFGAAVAIVGAGLMGYNAIRSGSPLQTGYDLTLFSPNILLGLYKLLFSPLRGLFVYSPLLLLSLPGWWRLRRSRPAEAWLFAGLVGITVGLFSAWSSGEGLSWGSRFLVPVVPFLTIGLAPLVEQITGFRGRDISSHASGFTVHALSFTFYALLFLSFLIQILGVAINPWVFLSRLQTEFGGEFFLENTAALYNFRYSQVFGQIQGWSRQNSDLAWWQPWGFDAAAFWLSLGLVLFCGWLLVYQTHKTIRNRPAAAGPCEQAGDHGAESRPEILSYGPVRFLPSMLPWPYLAILVMVAITYFLLARYYIADRQFGPPDDGYTTALRTAAAQAGPGDPIVTVAPYHYHVPMNRFKARMPVIGFARQAWPPPETALALLQQTASGQRIWLTTVGFQPAAADNAAERWFSTTYYKAGDEWFPDETRLVEYDAGRPMVTRASNVIVGAAFRLVEVKVAESVRPGQNLPVEFVWLPLRVPEADYNLFVQLLAGNGAVAAQHDGPPNGGYTPTTTWHPGQRIVSRQAVPLPADLAAGAYRLIAGLYEPASGARLPVDNNGDFIELGHIELQP